MTFKFGVGIAGVQRIIYKAAGHDAWISVILAGIAAQIVGWVMVKTLLQFDSKDLYQIHDDVYGKWLGSLFNVLYSFYLMCFNVTVLRAYVEIVQTWLFPELPVWILNGLMLLLVIYGIQGGIRVIVGFCFFSVLYTIWQVALHDYYSPGKDPVLPIIERVGNEIHFHEAALFQDDRMVGKVLANEAVYLKLIRDRFKVGLIELSLSGKEFPITGKKKKPKIIHVALQNFSNNTKVKLIDPNKLVFQVRLNLQAQLQEISIEDDLAKPETIKMLENAIGKEMSREASELLKKIQKMGSDPVGFGERYMSSVRGAKLTTDEWHKMLARAAFDVKVKVTLLRTGVME